MRPYRVLFFKPTTGTKVRINVRAPDPFWAVLLAGDQMGFPRIHDCIDCGDWVPIYSKRLVKIQGGSHARAVTEG